VPTNPVPTNPVPTNTVPSDPGSIPLRLFNTLTREVGDFAPAAPPRVGLYSCGPTVYADQHIGNMRAYVFADTLKRALTGRGSRSGT
jgi:cysteinyl-tRNA synthetase